MPRPEELAFRAGTVDLAGTLLLPDGEGRHPWVLLLASWLPRDRDGRWDRAAHGAWFAADAPDADDGLLRRLAHALAARGVASLRYDKRGCGASGGEWSSAALFTLIDDARDAVGAMRSRGDLDLRRTAIVGHGEGATIALAVAIGDPAISSVGLVAPAARSWRSVLRSGVAARVRHPDARRHPIVSALDRRSEELIEQAERGEVAADLILRGGARVALGLAYWEQAFTTPPLALATMLHRSVTVACAARDRWAVPDEGRLLAEVLRASGNAPHVLEFDAGHDLAEVDDAGIGLLAAAIAERIESRELPPVLAAIEEIGSSR